MWKDDAVSGDRLKELLQQADALAGDPPRMPGDLAQRVRRLAGRRRRVQVSINAAAAILLAVGITLLWSQASTPLRPTTEPQVVEARPAQPDAAALRAEIDRLGREADIRLAVVRRTQEILEEMRRFDELETSPPVPDAVAGVRREVDQAAYVLVRQADRMCHEFDLCDSAAVKYRRVVDLFPDSCWAAVARQRLSDLESKGDVS